MQGKNVRIALFTLGGVVAVLLVFCLGVLVGLGALRPLTGGGLLRLLRFGRGHGAIGTVTSIQGNMVTMQDRNGQTQVITVIDGTGIEVGLRRRAQLQDIHPGDRILVIGSPANGGIQASFIRVLQTQPGGPSSRRVPDFASLRD